MSDAENVDQLEATIERIGHVDPGDVIVVRGWGGDFDGARAIVEHVTSLAPGVFVIFADGDVAIETFGRDDMARAGWVPIELLRIAHVCALQGGYMQLDRADVSRIRDVLRAARALPTAEGTDDDG